MTDELKATKLCRECCATIPGKARFCTECDSHQDWRRYFPVSSTVLALATALVSVISLAAPGLYGLFHTPRSDLNLSSVTLDGTTLRVVLINNGDAAGIMEQAIVKSEYLAPATKVRLRNDRDAMIQPGSSLLIFDVVPLLDADESFRKSLEMITYAIKKQTAPETNIIIGGVESDGTRFAVNYPLDVDSLFAFFRANSDRCSAIEKPDYVNGCIGTGVSPSEQFPNAADDSKPKN